MQIPQIKGDAKNLKTIKLIHMTKNTIIYPIRKFSILFIIVSLMTIPALAQNKVPDVPLFKSMRTTVHRAVQKDTDWTPGAIVDQIHFVRFDRKGRKLAENSLKPDGSADSKIIYVYNKEGHVKEEVIASIKQGGVTNVYQYHYDSQGRIDGKIKLDTERNPVSLDTIIRNKAGLVVQRIHREINLRLNGAQVMPFQETVNITYNNQGEVTEVFEESTLNKNGNSGHRELLKKDTMSLKRYSEGSAFERYNAPRSKRVDTAYDMFGNWIKRTEYNGAVPEFIVMRHIEYAGKDDTDQKQLLLQGKVKSVYQTSYIALPNGPDIINKGQKKGTFFIYRFDKNGRKTATIHYSDTGIPEGSTEYVYDANDYIEKEIHKSTTTKIESTNQMHYDDEGRLKSMALLDTNGAMLRKTIFRYDGEGNCIAELCFSKDGSKYSDVRNQYDLYGNLVMKQILVAPADAKGAEYQPITRIWNARGRIVEEKIGTPGNERSYTYQYSTRGEVISGTEAVNNDSPVKFVYKFYNDKYGNWKKRIKFIDNKPVLYEEREYTYYE